MKKCSRCNKTVNDDYIEFKCPNCSKSTIIRCDSCRTTSRTYTCLECGFEGP